MTKCKLLRVFLALYTFLNVCSCAPSGEMCGGTIEVSDEGSLQSPNYPNNYEPYKQCHWILTASQNNHVVLEFNSFEIEKDRDCSFDKVKIRDGDSEDSPLIGIFCGYRPPPRIRSTANKLLVMFDTDGTVQKTGFSATYRKEGHGCASIQHGCSHSCVTTPEGHKCTCNIGYNLDSDGKTCLNVCGGQINIDGSGNIESPNYPDDYSFNRHCEWILSAPEEKRITLKFNSFDLENQASCSYDKVKVRDGDSSDSPLIGIFCGNAIPPIIRSTSNKLFVTFETDYSVQRTGFSATYMTE